jgi:hypothetical protein
VGEEFEEELKSKERSFATNRIEKEESQKTEKAKEKRIPDSDSKPKVVDKEEVSDEPAKLNSNEVEVEEEGNGDELNVKSKVEEEEEELLDEKGFASSEEDAKLENEKEEEEAGDVSGSAKENAKEGSLILNRS